MTNQCIGKQHHCSGMVVMRYLVLERWLCDAVCVWQAFLDKASFHSLQTSIFFWRFDKERSGEVVNIRLPIVSAARPFLLLLFAMEPRWWVMLFVCAHGTQFNTMGQIRLCWMGRRCLLKCHLSSHLHNYMKWHCGWLEHLFVCLLMTIFALERWHCHEVQMPDHALESQIGWQLIAVICPFSLPPEVILFFAFQSCSCLIFTLLPSMSLFKIIRVLFELFFLGR